MIFAPLFIYFLLPYEKNCKDYNDNMHSDHSFSKQQAYYTGSSDADLHLFYNISFPNNLFGYLMNNKTKKEARYG
jgi:hypothetical protein